MKYIQFAIMAVLVFGLAASPALSGAFADDHVECDAEHENSERECDRETEQERERFKGAPRDHERGN